MKIEDFNFDRFNKQKRLAEGAKRVDEAPPTNRSAYADTFLFVVDDGASASRRAETVVSRAPRSATR